MDKYINTITESIYISLCFRADIFVMSNQLGDLFLGEDNSSSFGRCPLVANRSLWVKSSEHIHLLQTMH